MSVTDAEWQFMLSTFPIFKDNERNRRRILQIGMGEADSLVVYRS